MKIKKLLLKIFKLKTGASIAVILTAFPLVLLTSFYNFPKTVDSVLYVYSAYGLVVLIFFFINDVPRFAKTIKRKTGEIPIIGKYLSDIDFMSEFSIYQGIILNMAFAVYKIISSAIYSSHWLMSVGIYYIMLCIIRIILAKGIKISRDGKRLQEIKKYRLCGFLMLALNVAMVGMIFQMIRQNKSYEYKGNIIYISALFAFYSLTAAIINLVKFRHMHKPIISASKILTFAGALMSMMNLTTAMISSFGSDDGNFRRIMTSCVGTGVSLITLGMSVYMILRSNKMLKKFSENNFLDYIIIYDKLIAITNPDRSGNNKIECYDKNLTLLWKLTPPIFHMQKGNQFVSINAEDDSCIVNDFNGVRYWVKSETGEIYSKEFVK